jgi:Trypsin-like peptidase domain
MRLYRQKRQRGIVDGITGIAPIYKVSLEGNVDLIGTGFWITEKGHLVTAWHVIADNIGKDGEDRGPIYAIQTYADRGVVPRVLRKSDQHPVYDLALSETLGPGGYDANPTWTFSMTLAEPTVGDFVGTYSFLSFDQKFDGEKYEGISTDHFHGTLGIPDLGLIYQLRFAARINRGEVLEVFPEGRDRVIMPFPCFRSDIPIYGANSGGPVFNRAGQVCGVNCTSYEGQDISFHMPLKGILELWARDIELIPEDPNPRNRSILEMGLTDRVCFDPPLSNIFMSFWPRFLLQPVRWLLYLIASVRRNMTAKH